MNHIINFAAVMIMTLAPSIAAAHIGPFAHDAYLHGAAHGLEILTAL